jgi:hypothetical protein
LIKMHQRKSGLSTTFDEDCVVPIEDFKACLKAFSMKVGEKVSDLNLLFDCVYVGFETV